MLQEIFPSLLRCRRSGARQTWRWHSTTGARLRRNPMSQRDLAELQLVRDGLASGPTTVTSRGMHLCNPVVNRVERRRLLRVADLGKI